MDDSPGGGQGPTKDAVLRAIMEAHLPTSIGWILDTMGCPPVPDDAIQQQPARFDLVRTTREVDCLVWIGADHLLHIEYESAPRRDLWPRLLEYRALIMKKHRTADLCQVVIVLGPDPIIARDESREGGFRLGVVIIRLPDQDPENLLSRPGLEPLAILSECEHEDAESIYRRAVARLTAHESEDQEKLLIALITLAFGVLPVPTIERLQEEGMFTYEEIAQQMREAPISGQLMREAEERGLEQGREQAYADTLELRFGADERIPAVARALAALSRAQAKRALLAASSIEDLPTIRPE